ncbi:MAG: DNA polymerase IV [Clostridia bacterium]|nr:DNA polymerase IV [Clostridia bacterium]
MEKSKIRAILHSDANCFYASCEMVLQPELRDKAVAVCGNTEERHGIVLAKSEKAKKAGITTGMPNWEALKKCPDLIIVPPRFEYYSRFSKLLHQIYERYTDYVEPFGLDECWLDVTDNIKSPMTIAEEIRQAVKDELGLTVSIGVSFNKVFAKLGSDMKKPDAITEITPDNFKLKVWPLPCSELLYCGRQTTVHLERLAVHTIGQLAALPLDYVEKKFGKNGHSLWHFANGLDESRVAHKDHYEMPKSVGHGVTCVENLNNIDEANKVLVSLSQDIGYKLRKTHLFACGVSLTVKDKNLVCQSYQLKLGAPTQDELTISRAALKLLKENYSFKDPIRALTVTAINLNGEGTPTQAILLHDYDADEKRSKLNCAIDDIKNTFGKEIIKPAVILDESKMPKNRQKDTVLPGLMHK